MAIKTPGSVLQGLLDKHGMNCNRLAKAINMSNAMVRLIVLDKSPISLAAAFRLGKFFKTKPEYWLELQMKYDLSQAPKDKSLARDLKNITDVSKYSFVRKPHAAQKTGRKKTAAKTAKKTGRKKTKTTAVRRKTAKKAPVRRARRVVRRRK